MILLLIMVAAREKREHFDFSETRLSSCEVNLPNDREIKVCSLNILFEQQLFHPIKIVHAKLQSNRRFRKISNSPIPVHVCNFMYVNSNLAPRLRGTEQKKSHHG